MNQHALLFGFDIVTGFLFLVAAYWLLRTRSTLCVAIVRPAGAILTFAGVTYCFGGASHMWHWAESAHVITGPPFALGVFLSLMRLHTGLIVGG